MSEIYVAYCTLEHSAACAAVHRLYLKGRVLSDSGQATDALGVGTRRSHAMRMAPEGCWPSLSAPTLAGGKRSALP